MIVSAKNSFRFANSMEQLTVHDHACLLFENSKEQFAAIVPYIKSGLMRGEKCICFIDNNPAETTDFLTAGGIDTDVAQASGALVIAAKEQSLLLNGYFEPDKMVALLTASVTQAQTDGFTALRIVSEMSWLPGKAHGVKKMVEYEAKLNNFISQNPVINLCQYNLTLFPSEVIRDAIFTHPTVICLDTLCRNPYYVPPNELLEENDASREVKRLMANMVERERIEQGLALKKHALDQVHEAAFLMDDQGRLHYVNQEACRSLGYSRDELLGMSIPDINPDYSLEGVTAIINGLLKRSSLTFETRRRTRDGRIFPVEVTSSLFEHGGCRYVLALARDITERKRVENTLRESEERFRSMFEKHNAVMLLIEPESGAILNANRAAEIFYGYPPDRLKQMTIGDINMLLPDNIARERENAVLEKRNFFIFPHRLANGETRFVEVHSSPILIQGQSILFSIIHDITERKQTEEALRISQERVKALYNSITDALFVHGMNPDGSGQRFLEVNDVACQRLGYTRDELLSMSPGDIDAPDSDADLGSVITQINAGKTVIFEQTHIAKDGTRIPVEICARKFRLEEKPAIFSLVRDITERKRMEEALVIREQEFRSLAENSPDNITRYDCEGRTLYMNPCLEKFLGMPAWKFIGKKLETERFANYRDMLQKVIATGVNAEVEMTFPDVNGDFLYHQIKFVPERDPEGAMISILAIGRDITELKQAEQALLDKQQRLSSMTVELSLAEERERRRIANELHDNIGQDLVLAQIKLGMLTKSFLPDVEAGILGNTREILGSIIQRVRFLTHMISPPILESGGLEAALKWLARQMEADYCLQITFVDDSNKKNLSKEIQSVLYHAVRELLINVAKHAECSTALVSVGRNGNNIVIKIEDDGVGFDSYSIEENLATGSGFGLINVRRRLCHLGGAFTIESSPGAGTGITVTMPLTKNRTKA